MRFHDVIYLIFSDIYRYYGRTGWRLLLKELLWGFGTRYSFYMRFSAYLKQRGRWFFPIYALTRLFQRHYMIKFGFDIPITTNIGPGFYLGHFGGIVISSLAQIGRNCNLSPGVVIGAIFEALEVAPPRLATMYISVQELRLLGMSR